MAAHRYWRMNITATVSGHSGVNEFEWRSTAGGVDRTGSGTAATNSTFSGFPASDAFDNNNSTSWATSGSALPHWISYDFGAGNAWDIVEISILPRPGSLDQGPTTFQWQYSDDNSAWTTVVTKTGLTWPTSAAQIIDVSAPATHYVQHFDRYQSTVASAYTAGATSLVVTSATGLPSTGDYWLLVEVDGSNTEEVFRVTSRSGTTLTVIGAKANTTASNHGAGAVIRGSVLTAESLAQWKTDP